MLFGDRTFAKIIQHITGFGRPVEALCAIELRVPKPLSFEGFERFNEGYRKILEKYGLLQGEVNPLARTNISPLGFQVEQPSIYAFSFTITEDVQSESPTFIVAER